MKKRIDIVIFNGQPTASDIRFSMRNEYLLRASSLSRGATLTDVSKVVTAAVTFPAAAGNLAASWAGHKSQKKFRKCRRYVVLVVPRPRRVRWALPFFPRIAREIGLAR